MRYNLAAHNANIRVVARFICDKFYEEAASAFIGLAAEFPNFPYLSIGEILSSCAQSGLTCTAKHADVDQLMLLQSEALIFINRRIDLPYSLEVVRLLYSQSDHFMVLDEYNELLLVRTDDMRRIFSGVVILADGKVEELEESGIFKKPFVFHERLMSSDECDDIVNACESLGFSDIPNSNMSFALPTELSVEAELGMRLDIHATGKILNDRLNAAIAHINCKSDLVCEGAECFKISSHCKPYRRFDSGVNLRRRMSVHMAVGHCQGDINLRFTECRKDQVLRIGDAVSIESCDSDGRMNWRSEWSLLPPQNGNIYLISCWFIKS